MKNKLLTIILCALSGIAFLISSVFCVSADTVYTDNTQNLIDGIIEYKLSSSGSENLQEFIDGELTEGAGTLSEWYVIALHQYDSSLDFSSYARALENYLEANKITSASSRQKYALALLAAGAKDSTFISSTLEDSIGKQGIMSYIYGLHLINNGLTSQDFTSSDIATHILSLHNSDGGWSLIGSTSDVDITSMAVQALAPYYESNGNVKEAVDKALSFLSDAQLEDGDYISYGVANPESTAQVLLALTSLSIDPLNDARFIKNGNNLIDALAKYRCNDGGYCHKLGEKTVHSATVQTFYSLISLYRLQNGKGPFYNFDKASDIPDGETSGEDTPGNIDEGSVTDKPITNTPNTNSEKDPSFSDNSANQDKEKSSYKFWAILAVIVTALGICLAIYFTKKKLKDMLLVFSLAALVICAILFINIESTDDYYQSTSDPENTAGSVTLTIRCDTIAGKSDNSYIPEDGIILECIQIPIEEGDSVYDVLLKATKDHKIQMETVGVSDYVSGINHIYEFDFGDTSGWIFLVNGERSGVGCDKYSLKDGDEIAWHYSLELGNDIESTQEDGQ